MRWLRGLVVVGALVLCGEVSAELVSNRVEGAWSVPVALLEEAFPSNVVPALLDVLPDEAVARSVVISNEWILAVERYTEQPLGLCESAYYSGSWREAGRSLSRQGMEVMSYRYEKNGITYSYALPGGCLREYRGFRHTIGRTWELRDAKRHCLEWVSSSGIFPTARRTEDLVEERLGLNRSWDLHSSYKPDLHLRHWVAIGGIGAFVFERPQVSFVIERFGRGVFVERWRHGERGHLRTLPLGDGWVFEEEDADGNWVFEQTRLLYKGVPVERFGRAPDGRMSYVYTPRLCERGGDELLAAQGAVKEAFDWRAGVLTFEIELPYPRVPGGCGVRDDVDLSFGATCRLGFEYLSRWWRSLMDNLEGVILLYSPTFLLFAVFLFCHGRESIRRILLWCWVGLLILCPLVVCLYCQYYYSGSHMWNWYRREMLLIAALIGPMSMALVGPLLIWVSKLRRWRLWGWLTAVLLPVPTLLALGGLVRLVSLIVSGDLWD